MNINLTINQEHGIEIFLTKGLKNCKKEDKKLLKKLSFEGKENQSCLLGKRFYIGTNNFHSEDVKIAFSNAVRELNKTKFTKFTISLRVLKKELDLKNIVEGLVLGNYSFNKYKSENKVKEEKYININYSKSKKTKDELEEELNSIISICESVNLVRDFVNTSPEDFYPKTMAEKAQSIASLNDLKCDVFGEKYLKNNGMNAMFAVGRASRHESQLIHLTYKPKDPKGKVVVVGKGLTYDSGGLSLKSSGGMVSMKCDKSGGAAVLGIMNSLKALNYPYEVHGIIGAVENMIGGDAYKPDDILKAKNGKTIEVRNTDAEGRLVLADCLCYAQDEVNDIDYIFDVATLTGACIVGLGEYTTGVMGHSEKLKKKLAKASKDSGELVGFLPFNRYLPSMIKSSIADITNSASSRAGGSITASLFLDNFIKKENKKKWLHFDIAGAAYREKSWGYNPYGGTGAGVRMILKFIENLK